MGLAPHVDSPRHQLDTQGQGAKSGASAGAGKQAEGTYRPSPRPQAPPRERSPSDPRQPLGAPHLGSRDALLAFGAQVSLWPGWSLWGDTEGFPERPCSGSVTHSPAPDTCLRSLARQGLLLQFLGLMGSPHPVWEALSAPRGTHGKASEARTALRREDSQDPPWERLPTPSPSRGASTSGPGTLASTLCPRVSRAMEKEGRVPRLLRR